MRDAAEMVSVMTAKLRREMDEGECKRRNALSKTSPGLVLRPGDVVTVVETFGTGEAFLVEFNKKGRVKKDFVRLDGRAVPDRDRGDRGQRRQRLTRARPLRMGRGRGSGDDVSDA